MRRWSHVTLGGVGLVVSLSLLAADAWAIPPMIGYSGRLIDASGQPVTGTHDMVFRIYEEATGGTPLFVEFFEDAEAIAVNGGYFWVLLANNEGGGTLELDLMF